jgi:hypothetical protein
MRIASFVVCGAALVLGACSSPKMPAEAAVSKAEASLSEIRLDAETYAPEQLAKVDASVAEMKQNLARDDFNAVVKSAPVVNADIESLRTAISTARGGGSSKAVAAAQSEWDTLATEVPELVQTIEARLATLVKEPKLPENIDAAAIEAAKSGLSAVKAEWEEASQEFTQGRADDAVRRARNAKAKGEDVLYQLGNV